MRSIPGPMSIHVAAALLIVMQLFWSASMCASAGTVLSEGPSQCFENGTANGTVQRSPDGALVLDRSDILGTEANWSLAQAGQPSPRRGGVMAYDPHHNVSVLFGGSGGSNETWEYDFSANAWSQARPSPSPSARYGAAMAYDSRNGVMILFGGSVGSTTVNDTWAYDVATRSWSRNTPPNSPSPRYSQTMAYDPATGLVVLFGGYSNGNKGDTWVYNYTADNWTERTPSSPPAPRIMHSMAYNERVGLIVLFGGLGRGDTWTYNVRSNTWTDMAPSSSPSARGGSLMAYDAADGLILLFGGSGQSGFLQDSWTYSASTNTWTMLAPPFAPAGRDSASGTYDASGGVLVMFGGQASFAPSEPVGDTWTFSYPQNRWTAMIPTARSSQGMAADGTGKVLMFGGRDNFDPYKSDTWVLETERNMWSSKMPATSPPPRNFPSMAYDDAHSVFVLFGGYYPVRNDTWTYYHGADTWVNASPVVSPSPRLQAAMAYDADSRASILFGGSSMSTTLGDSWKYDAGADTWTRLFPMASPGARNMHAMAYDRASHRIVLFGGTNGSFLGDTWTFNLTENTWKNVTPASSPPARLGHSMVYDQARGLVVLFGGRNGGGYLGDTWAYDIRQNTWTNIATPACPGARGMHSAAFDRVHNVTVLFGGSNGSYQGDSWTFPAETGFRPSGEFVSQPHDSGGGAYFGAIIWNSTTPAGTALRFQVRTANTSSELTGAVFSGPDGTDRSYYAISGERIWSGHNGSRWLQYKAFLSTDDDRTTPVLQSVDICYNRMHKVTVYSPTGGESLLGDCNITWTAIDPDGDGLRFDLLLSRDGGATFTVPLARGISLDFFVWNSSTQPPGAAYRIRVVARDDNASIPISAYAESDNFAILRTNVVPTTELLSPPDGALIRGGTVSFGWNGSDADGDDLTYFVWMDGAAVARVNATGYTPANLSEGVHRWTVIPNDGFGNGTCSSGIRSFNFTANLPPVSELIAPAPGAIVRTSSMTLLWSSEDAENDPLLNHVLVDGSEMGFANGTAFGLGGLANGSHIWTVIPADGLGNGSCLSGVWNFTVGLNVAPAVFLLEPRNGSEVNNTTVELGWGGADFDNDTLLYSFNITDGDRFTLSANSSSNSKTVTLEDGKKYLWYVTVSDGIDMVASATSSFTVRTNHRPGILSLPPLSARAGMIYTYQVGAVDPDGDPLRFSLARCPEGMTVDAGGKVLWRPNASVANKAFTVEVVVTDGGLEDRQAFVVRVLAEDGASVEDPTLLWITAAAVVAAFLAVTLAWRRTLKKRRLDE
jgi:hypothetical protein